MCTSFTWYILCKQILFTRQSSLFPPMLSRDAQRLHFNTLRASHMILILWHLTTSVDIKEFMSKLSTSTKMKKNTSLNSSLEWSPNKMIASRHESDWTTLVGKCPIRGANVPKRPFQFYDDIHFFKSTRSSCIIKMFEVRGHHRKFAGVWSTLLFKSFSFLPLSFSALVIWNRMYDCCIIYWTV